MQALKYKLVYGFFFTLSLLPFGFLYAVAALLCPFVYHVIKYRRGIVRKNLTNAFPQKNQKEIIKIEHDFYRFFCNYFVETIKLLSISKKEMKKRMTFCGLDEMEKALNEHDFCFVYLGHYGNWEWMSSMVLWTSSNVHCAQIYHKLRSNSFNKLFLDMRSRFGGENISKNNTLRRVLSLKKEGKKTIIGFISDQIPKQINIHDWVTFLNQETGVFTGTERIAKKIDAAVFYGDMRLKSRGYYNCTFRPITLDSRSYPDFKITELYMSLLEQTISQSPAFWLWSHNRWKRKREG